MRKLLLGLLAAAGLIVVPASATTIYSNLGPGQSYNCCSGFWEGGATGMTGGIVDAVRFTSPFNATIEQIDLSIGNVMGTNTAVVNLWTESAGLPGVMLDGWEIIGIAPMGSPNLLMTINVSPGVNLAAGSNYFLSVGPADPADDSVNIWTYGGAGKVGFVPADLGSGWDATDANGVLELGFDIIGSVDASAVPEPATMVLMIGGIAGAVRLRRRKAG